VAPATVAVRVTCWPTEAGLGDAVRVVVCAEAETAMAQRAAAAMAKDRVTVDCPD
jgi:hypothetical protein